MEDGGILELNTETARVTGKVDAGDVYVDGMSVGESVTSNYATGD